MPERFFCASEHMAAVPIPSLTSAEAFDSGVALGAVAARRLLDHGRQAYAASRRVESAEPIAALEVVRGQGAGPVNRAGVGTGDLLQAAREDQETVVGLARDLVRIRSRAVRTRTGRCWSACRLG